MGGPGSGPQKGGGKVATRGRTFNRKVIKQIRANIPKNQLATKNQKRAMRRSGAAMRRADRKG